MSIGERIMELRKRQNISQVQVADFLGISRQAVSKWENDLSVPDMTNLILLADLFGTDTEYLATGVHAVMKSPAVIPAAPKVEIVEKVIEKTIPVEKIVEVERIVEVEKIVEIPRVKKVVRIKYARNPLEFAVVALAGFLLGLVIGLLF